MNKTTSTSPHLTEVFSSQSSQLENQVIGNHEKIESWFQDQWQHTAAPFYTSVDIRNSGYKVVPVDTNLFPAGFNNLNLDFEDLYIKSFQLAVKKIDSNVSSILLIPENHTRNMHYLENVAAIISLVTKAGFDVRVGSLISDLSLPISVKLDSGIEMEMFPLTRKKDRILVGKFKPDLILLNNDLSAGRPKILEGLDQLVAPSLDLGWSTRLKSVHFTKYQKIAEEFSNYVGIDPWLINPLFRNCGEINFLKRKGNSCLESNVIGLLSAIQKKYDEYDISQEPYVVVKADSGTYGMGVIMANSAEEVIELNRKDRARMSKTKEGKQVKNVIIQEGVYTNETWGPKKIVAEPVVYTVDKDVIGGFYRVHASKGVNENLNSLGMSFKPLAFDDNYVLSGDQKPPPSNASRFYSYKVIARLANLAAARESE